jgi:hypothetical protein
MPTTRMRCVRQSFGAACAFGDRRAIRQAIFDVPTSSTASVAERRGESGLRRGGTSWDFM